MNSALFNMNKKVNVLGIPITVNLGNAFTLFLILILLILATNLGGIPAQDPPTGADPPADTENPVG